MKRFFRSLTSLILITALAVSLTACGGGGSGEKKMKVALCLSGSINDGGWNASAYEGLKRAEEELGVETSYTENLDMGSTEAALLDYASQGYDLIIGHGFQFGDPSVAVGAQYPDTKFICIASAVSAENVASYDMKDQDAGYLMGMLAAGMSKSGVIGIVAGTENPSVIKFSEAYKLGARAVNPDIDCTSAFTGSWTDVAAAKEAAMAMIDRGADVVGHSANEGGVGVIRACEERGVLATCESEDQHELAPDTVLASPIYRMPDLIYNAIKDVIDGNFKGEMRALGVKEDIIELAPYYNFEDQIPEEIKSLVAGTIEQLKSGEFEAPVVLEITR